MDALVGTEKYDAVVRVNVFTNVYRPKCGWPVELASAEVFERLETANSVRVAPIGVFNVGKSWLLQKLCEKSGVPLNLPSGVTIHTEGLSLKQIPLAEKDGNSCVFLDTAGLNSPVSSVPALGHMLKEANGDPMRAMENMLQELRRQENFIRQVAYDFAQVFLVVVGQISQRDQLDLVQLIEQATRGSEQKEVIVVHNLKNMTLAEFNAPLIDQITGAAGDTYLESMEKVFRLRRRPVSVVGFEGATIPELFGAFGGVVAGGGTPQQNASNTNAPGAVVTMRHVFLTKDGPAGVNFAECLNEPVFEHIRTLIAGRTPVKGSVLRDLAKIASHNAKSLVRLPGDNIEIRYHGARKVFQGGRVRQQQAAAGAAGAAGTAQQQQAAPAQQQQQGSGAKPKELVEAEAALAKLEEDAKAAQEAASTAGPDADVAALGKAAQQLEDKMLEATVKVNALRMQLRALVDAADLDELLPGEDVTARPVMLGAVAATAGQQHVRHNVSRVKGYVQGMPCWITMVHMTVPALAAGELAAVTEQLNWAVDASQAAGLSMTAQPGQEETLLIRFKTRILPLGAKQVELLNLQGDPKTAAAPAAGGGAAAFMGGAVKVQQGPPEVVEMGSRPFPRVAGAAGAAPDGSFELEVSLHTNVALCICDVPPVVNYARGILTTAVLCQLTEAEFGDPQNQLWVSGGLTAVEADEWAPGSNGSGDDTPAP